MNDPIIFRRRNRIKNDIVITSKVLLYGYKSLSDGAKLTYQVIDGFDWEDKQTKTSKGLAFPATETLALIRNASVRTIERHLKELEKVNLLNRTRRRNLPSILYIEDISKVEINQYLGQYVNSLKESKKNKHHSSLETSAKDLSRSKNPDADEKLRNDKNVVSQNPLEKPTKLALLTENRETTKMSFAYKGIKEKEIFKENEINVNVEKRIKKSPRRTNKISSIGALLKTYNLPLHVSTIQSKEKLKASALAEDMANKLNDHQGLGCFRKIASKIPQPVVYETLASVKEAARVGEIHNQAAVFIKVIKDYATKHQIKLGFKPTLG
jgi:hypothetical protein